MILLAQEGNEDAANLIYTKFKPIIVKKSKHAFFKITNHGVDIDDIIQEACIGLDEAIKNYSQEEETRFYTFAMICIERQISNFIRKVNTGKDKILNEAVAIDDTIEKIVSDDMDVENSITWKEYKLHVINSVRKQLTAFERKVLDLKLADYSLDEMAKLLVKDKKAIYNALQRIKVKFRNFNENDD